MLTLNVEYTIGQNLSHLLFGFTNHFSWFFHDKNGAIISSKKFVPINFFWNLIQFFSKLSLNRRGYHLTLEMVESRLKASLTQTQHFVEFDNQKWSVRVGSSQICFNTLSYCGQQVVQS